MFSLHKRILLCSVNTTMLMNDTIGTKKIWHVKFIGIINSYSFDF